jgi:hypothetical protein
LHLNSELHQKSSYPLPSTVERRTDLQRYQAKFGDSVKAMNGRAMVNDVLAKFVCHNLSCFTHAMEEYGIDANFRTIPTSPSAQAL